MADKAPPEVKKRDQLMVYLGLRCNSDGLRVEAWAWVASVNDSASDVALYVVKRGESLQKRAVCGGLYRMKVAVAEGKDGKPSVFLNQGTYLHRWGDEDAVARWQVEDAAAERELGLQARAASDARDRLDLAALKPFRDCYRAAHGTKRGLILSLMIEYVTKL